MHRSNDVEGSKIPLCICRLGFVFFRMIEEFELMYEDDIATNKAMGQFGAQHILAKTGKSKVNILTHCNTGSLATAGHGTALGKPLMFVY